MNEANERQVAGDHYKAEYQHWDWVEDIGLSYLPAQITKYLTRWKKKNGIQDLEKSLHFLDKHIETIKKKAEHRASVTNKFLKANEVEYIEREIIVRLMAFEDGHVRYLDVAREALSSLINRVKAKDYTG